jgi:hypothetical protein
MFVDLLDAFLETISDISISALVAFAVTYSALKNRQKRKTEKSGGVQSGEHGRCYRADALGLTKYFVAKNDRRAEESSCFVPITKTFMSLVNLSFLRCCLNVCSFNHL